MGNIEDKELVSAFMGGIKTRTLDVDAWNMPNMNGLQLVTYYDTSWDWLMPVIRKINNMGKEYQFSIFKTYVSCTVEKSSKFTKNFSFSHAEYITQNQTDIEAAFKLVVRFIKWYNES